MTETTATRQAVGNGKPGQKNVTVNQDITTTKGKNQILNDALSYIKKGKPVFPCNPTNKTPLTKNGFKDASTDPAAVKKMWTKNPEAAIGIPTGKKSGLVVVDLDDYKTNFDQAAWHEILEKIGGLPKTLTQRTGGGGRQYFFKNPGETIKCRTGLITGLDIKASGGYVIVPPSKHPSGGTYKWLDRSSPAPLPDGLLELIKGEKQAPETPPQTNQPHTPNNGAYASKALEGETNRVLSAPEGTRNDTLNRAAFALGQLVAGGELDHMTVEGELLTAAVAAGLNQAEARKTVQSGMKNGARSPRRTPEPSYTGDDFQATGDQDKPEPWEQIIPLDAQEVDQIDPATLPGIIGEYAQAVARETETHLELEAGMLFVVIAACVQGRVKIQIKPGYCEPLVFWTVAPMDPATRKSQVLKRMTAPLTEWERRKRAEFEPLIKARRIERENTQARIKSLRTRYGKAKPDELEKISDEIFELENNLEPELVSPQVWAQDCTPENAGQIMGRNDERLTILAAEGGVLDTLGGRYSAGVANLDLFLQGYSGDSVKVNRTSRADIFLNNPALSLGLMPQPQVLQGIAAKPEFKGRGFIGRPFYMMPESNLGNRTLDSEPIPEHIKIAYYQTIESLLEIQPIDNLDGTSEPHTLNLSQPAFEEWKDFYLTIERDLADGGRFEHCRDWAGKTPGRAARLAGLLHCAINPAEPWRHSVTLETMEQALDITVVSCSHALAVFSLMGADPAIESAGRVLQWVKRHQNFTKRQAFEALKGTFNRATMLDEPLNVLAERNYVRAVEPEKKPGRPSETFEVNPAIHQGG